MSTVVKPWSTRSRQDIRRPIHTLFKICQTGNGYNIVSFPWNICHTSNAGNPSIASHCLCPSSSTPCRWSSCTAGIVHTHSKVANPHMTCPLPRHHPSYEPGNRNRSQSNGKPSKSDRIGNQSQYHKPNPYPTNTHTHLAGTGFTQVQPKLP